MLEFISQPWPWYVAGPIIALVMFALLVLGNRFGLSSNLRSICSILGAGRSCDFFDFDWKSQRWNLIFATGLVIGGFLSNTFLMPDTAVGISQTTIEELESFGMVNPGETFVPELIFTWKSILTLKGFIMLVIGGFLVGFGTRYAGGCTSGHAISGLSDLQVASLIAVVGFFIGGLAVTYLVLPHLLTL